jgi:predicted HicB family RNase H-like nuclease
MKDNKKLKSVHLNEDLHKIFVEHCDKEGLKINRLVEKLIEKYLREYKY